MIVSSYIAFAIAALVTVSTILAAHYLQQCRDELRKLNEKFSRRAEAATPRRAFSV